MNARGIAIALLLPLVSLPAIADCGCGNANPCRDAALARVYASVEADALQSTPARVSIESGVVHWSAPSSNGIELSLQSCWGCGSWVPFDLIDLLLVLFVVTMMRALADRRLAILGLRRDSNYIGNELWKQSRTGAPAKESALAGSHPESCLSWSAARTFPRTSS